MRGTASSWRVCKLTEFAGKIFDEPLLEFGDKHSHPDPRLGLSEAGPHQTYVGEVIKIGVVGSSKTIEDARLSLPH
mgnify:CR=1 FL=1